MSISLPSSSAALSRFSDLKLKWKIVLVLGLLLVPTSVVGLLYVFNTVRNLEVYTALSGLMNFVDTKQQGVIRFLGQNEKLARQLAILVGNTTPEVAGDQFRAIVETDVFKLDEHRFKDEIEEGRRRIAAWEVYHAIDFVRLGVIEISSNPARIGRRIDPAPDIRHGYSDVYMDGDAPILSFGAPSRDGMVYVHANAGMLTVITNGEIGNLEGDMGAYYLAGVGKTFDYYIVNRNNTMITESRVYPDALLKRQGSEFPWLMTMNKAIELGIICLPDGTYRTNAGHYTGIREAMGFYTGHNGREMLGASMPFYDSEWTIVVEQEASELLGPLNRMAANVALGTVLLLGILGWAGFVLATSISRPLTAIVGDVTRLTREDTGISIHEKDRKDEIGDLANALEVFRENIVEKNQAAETLRKLSQAVEQSPNMVFITDIGGTIEYVNGKFTELTGFRAAEAVGQNPRILGSGLTPKETYREMWQTILAGRNWRGEIEDRHRDGSVFWASVTISPVKTSDGTITHFVSVHEDISERKEAEARIRQAKETADIANRAKTELIANMSHELRTPLNAILGFSQTIQNEVFGAINNEKYMDYVNSIHESGAHLLEVINDILDVSAIEAGKIELDEESVELHSVAEAAQRIVTPRAEQGRVTISNAIDPGLPLLHADERRLKQVLLNLLSNAVKFTPPGGAVSMDAWRDPSHALCLTVIDTGIGMDSRELEIAMSEFGQVDGGLARKQEGIGLGLPLTKRLVDLHGGTIDFKSAKGKGTRVLVRFPVERTVGDALPDLPSLPKPGRKKSL